MADQKPEAPGMEVIPPVSPPSEPTAPAEGTVEPAGEDVAGGDDQAKLRAELAAAKQRQAGFDRTVLRLQREKEALQVQLQSAGSAGVSQQLLDRLTRVEDTQALILDRQASGVPDEEAARPRSYVEELKERRAAEEVQAKQAWELQVNAARQGIQATLEAFGVPDSVLVQDAEFMTLWRDKGDLKGAHVRAVEVARQVRFPAGTAPSVPPAGTVEPEETAEQRIERLADEKYHQTLRARGLLMVETGSSQGSGSPTTFTEAQLQDRKFWEANKQAILKAQADGTFKLK